MKSPHPALNPVIRGAKQQHQRAKLISIAVIEPYEIRFMFSQISFYFFPNSVFSDLLFAVSDFGLFNPLKTSDLRLSQCQMLLGSEGPIYMLFYVPSKLCACLATQDILHAGAQTFSSCAQNHFRKEEKSDSFV